MVCLCLLRRISHRKVRFALKVASKELPLKFQDMRTELLSATMRLVVEDY